MPPSCSTTVPSIRSRLASRSSRIPFWVMSCQIVKPSDTGITPAIASAILGCFASVADSAKVPTSRAGTKSRKPTRKNRTRPSTPARDSPVKRADLVLRQDGKVDLQQVRNNANRHISVDACTRVFDQKPAQHIHHFTHEVSATDDGQIHGGDVRQMRPATGRDWSGGSPR